MGKFNFSDETGTWVRVSEYSHADPDMPLITLLPMIHIGEKEYFKEMNNEMWWHDTVFLEGCYMKGRKLFHIFHRTFAGFSKLSLQSGKLSLWKKWKREKPNQGQTGLTETIRKSGFDCGNCYSDELRTIRADLHRWHAVKALKLIPLWAKLSFPFLILIAILVSPFLNLRDYSFDDETEEEETDDEEDEFFLEKLMAPFWKFVLDDRDLFLRMVLAEEIMRPRHRGKRLCVKYGAKHMPALAETFLKDFGYTLAKQRDVLAVKKTKTLDVTNIETGYGVANERYWDDLDARREAAKEKVWELTETNPNNFIALNIRESEDKTPLSLSIQTDLSGFTKSLTPADAA